jgi:hypothetical protein
MRKALLGLPGLLLPAGLWAQTPQPAAKAAPQATPYVIRYEPGSPAPLPIQHCEIQSIQLPRPHTVQLPVNVKIWVFDPHQLRRQAMLFQGTLKEPMKLDPGVYAIEVEGHKEPIYVSYATEGVGQMYLIYKEPQHLLIGPFFIPGIGRLPTGQYIAKGTNFELSFECRNKERAVFNVLTYDSLPPFLAPAQGLSW